MSTPDITAMLAGLRGEDFIAALRGIHADAQARGGGLQCGFCGNRATLLGMQRCGEPGPPICAEHWRHQQEWMAAAASLGQPSCRHCKADVDSSHIYVIPLEGETS